MSRTKNNGDLPPLRGRVAELLLSMRPASIASSQIEERFGCRMSSLLSALARHGLIESCYTMEGPGYRLTPAGRERCPTRRELYATAEHYIAQHDAARFGLAVPKQDQGNKHDQRI